MKIQRISNDYGDFGQRRDVKTKPNFKRAWEEHISWGANYVANTGKTNFKLFSFPDAKAVFVEIADKAKIGLSNIKERIVNFAGVAGAATAITTVTTQDDESKLYPMKHNGNGVYEANDIDAKPEDKYRYIVVTNKNEVNLVKDPYAKKQEDINGWSSVYSQNNYKWKNTAWLNGRDTRRIVRQPSEDLRGLERLVIAEINIPTMSKEGTFDAAKENIDKIAAKKIATAIEILPVENTYSMQWGYDGVDKFAVNEKLGGSAKLKELIDYTHGKGLNVIIDMVPNHMGPDGDYLDQTGPYEKGPGEFGGEFNYEGKNNQYVRDWMVNAALWWASEYKVDGIRLDMTKLCGSDYLLMQIATEVNEHFPNVFLIAEDGRDNKESITRYEHNKGNHTDNLAFIDTQVDFISKQNGWNTTPGNIGLDTEWDFPFMQILKKALLEPGSNLLSSLDYRIKTSNHRVKYVMSHDEIGNEDGTRLMVKILSRHLDLFNKVNGYSDAEKGQRAAHAAQKLSELVISKEFPKMTEEELKAKEEEFGLNAFISSDNLRDAFNTAIAKQKLAHGTIFTIPGPKMYFQGDEVGDLSYFKFFREFSGEKYKRAESDKFKDSIIDQKGYDTLEEIARPDSIVCRIEPQGYYKDIKNQMRNFNSDLRTLIDNTPSLQSGKFISTYNDNNHNVHIHHLQLGTEEVLIIKNFGYGFHDKNYGFYGFPQNGQWVEIFSSDEKKYGGSGYNNKRPEAITHENQNLSLAPNSFIILKKIN